MNAGSPQDPARKTRCDESDAATDPLWRLLAQSPRPEPDAWFAARTLARCRLEGSADDSRANPLSHLALMWRWALGGGLALVMAFAFVMKQVQSERADNQKNVQEAFEIVASMDTDSESSSSSSWQDSSL
jgi:hypothetical protein